MEQQFSIKPVEENLLSKLPYNAVVKIVTNFSEGSGFLVKQNDQIFVQTAAHVLYDQSQSEQVEHQKVSILVQTLDGLKQVKNNIIVIPKRYLKTKKTKYDMARIYLDEKINVEVFLQLEWNHKINKYPIQVIGFSSDLDQTYNKKNSCYHLKCSEIDQFFQSHFIYKARARKGISGGAVVIYKDGNFKAIGLHQGRYDSYSSQGVLFSNTTKIISNQLEQENKKLKKLKKSATKLYEKGVQQFDLNNLDQAFFLFEECQYVQKLYRGTQTVQYANTINMIGVIEKYKNNYDRALYLFEQSLMIKQKTVGKKQNYADTLQNIGNIYWSKGDRKKTMKCFKQVLKIKQTTVGQYHQSYAKTLQIIGIVYNERNKHQKALMNYQNAKKIYQKRTGKKNGVDYAGVMNNIGVTHQLLDHAKTALGYYSQCVQIMIKTNNQKHPDFQKFKNNLQQMKTKLNSK